jgi:Txe/YoeB family toxin of Txe-Axe toxin-antitoxin module
MTKTNKDYNFYRYKKHINSWKINKYEERYQVLELNKDILLQIKSLKNSQYPKDRDYAEKVYKLRSTLFYSPTSDSKLDKSYKKGVEKLIYAVKSNYNKLYGCKLNKKIEKNIKKLISDVAADPHNKKRTTELYKEFYYPLINEGLSSDWEDFGEYEGFSRPEATHRRHQDESQDSNDKTEIWSKDIDLEHRLIYAIWESNIIMVLSIEGHDLEDNEIEEYAKALSEIEKE